MRKSLARLFSGLSFSQEAFIYFNETASDQYKIRIVTGDIAENLVGLNRIAVGSFVQKNYSVYNANMLLFNIALKTKREYPVKENLQPTQLTTIEEIPNLKDIIDTILTDLENSPSEIEFRSAFDMLNSLNFEDPHTLDLFEKSNWRHSLNRYLTTKPSSTNDAAILKSIIDLLDLIIRQGFLSCSQLHYCANILYSNLITQINDSNRYVCTISAV